jgi:Ca2+-binding EF-hand superfamily protein
MIRLLLMSGAVAVLTLASAEPGRGQQEKAKKPSPAVAELLKSSPQEFICRYDRNKDGYLSKEELPSRLTIAFDRIDANGDGKLDVKEVEQMLEMMRKRFGLDDESKTRPDDSKKNEAADRYVAKLLQGLDRNKDGKISKAEAQGRIAQAFDQFDANRDGYLDKEELRKLAARLVAQPGGGDGRLQSTGPDFDALDKNADGRLTRDELKGTPFADAFDAMDANKDGKVTPAEFEAFLKKQAQKKNHQSAGNR